MGFLIGTAGHIDHGKTALVHALTGQDTDQLPAEKRRGISIDLGFAHFRLPDQTSVGIVDVPGHEKFIRNMVAGAHGFDLVLFVVAADDGLMPQSEEHFDIICSLGVEQAIFVVTKMDKVDDSRLAEVAEEIAILVDASKFEGASVLPISNTTGAGIEALKAHIAATLSAVPTRGVTGWFRMPIDRVFTVHGRGVIITGTLVSGSLSIGDVIAIVPGESTYKVRGLQRHGVDVGEGRKGDRLAINLTGAERQAFRRGDIACNPAIARETERIDVTLSVAAHAKADLKNGQRVRLHLGTAENNGTVILLAKDPVIVRGETGLAQIKLTEPLQAMAGDHFVIRDEQAEHTLGGGKVLDPLGQKLRRTEPARRARLAAFETAEPIRRVEMLIDSSRNLAEPAVDAMFRLNMQKDEFLASVSASDTLFRLDVGAEIWITSTSKLDALNQAIKSALMVFHKNQPTFPGLAVEALHDQIARATDIRLFRAIVETDVTAGHLTRDGAFLALPSHQAGLSGSQQAQADALMERLKKGLFSPPAPELCQEDEKIVVGYLERQGKLIRVAPGMVFAAGAYEEANQKLEDYFEQHGEITAAQFRDLLGTTRKYALALLESFDRSGHTVRVGETRKRGKLKTG